MPTPPACDVLVPVLGDQLSPGLSSLRGRDKARTVVLMMEVAEETTYVRHHRRKIAFILSAMRHHAEALRADGWTVDYVRLDDPDNTGSFTGEVARAMRLARTRAIAGNAAVPVVLDPAEASIRVGDGPPRRLAAGIGLSVIAVTGAGLPTILFAPDGSSSGGRVELAAGGRRVQVGVEWLTGRVVVADAP